MSSGDPLDLHRNDPLEKWRAEAERREDEFARARRQREREERRAAEAVAANEAAQLRGALEEPDCSPGGRYMPTYRPR